MKNRFGRPGMASILLLLLELFALGPVAAQQPSAPESIWSYELGNGAAYGLGHSQDGGTLIAVVGFGFDPGGEIVSLDPVTGEVRWTVATDEDASADPIVVDGVVYAGMGNLVGGGAAVYALDAATGAELWSTDVENRELPATPVDAVVYSEGKLFVNRGDATLLKLDAATGTIDWELHLQKLARGAPFVDGDNVYVATGFDSARIFAFDAETGEDRWRVEEPVNPVT